MQRKIAGPTSATNPTLLQALSHDIRPVKVCIVVNSEDLRRFDELAKEVRWSRSRLFRKSMRALMDGQVIQSGLRGRQY